jgi:pSer/pThr/pTyr-binding forkhead associated (FHA) protein
MFIVSIEEKDGPRRTERFDQNEINIGRVVGNDLILPKGNISKHHARLLHRDGRFIITDLKSNNGVYVNGRKIAQATLITSNDKIYIGDFVLRCQGTSDEMTDIDESPIAAPAPIAPGLSETAPIVPDLFRDRSVVEVPSRITRVVVHARDALVTREVDLPADLATGTVEIMIGGITPLARGGSMRARLTGSAREVVQIETALQHGRHTPQPGPTRSRVRGLEERLTRLRDEGTRLSRRRERVASVQLVPPIRTTDRRQVQRDVLDAWHRRPHDADDGENRHRVARRST